MTRRVGIVCTSALLVALATPAFAGGHRGGRHGQVYTFNYNQGYSMDVGPNLRNLGYAQLGLALFGALLAPAPVVVAPPVAQGPDGVPYGPGLGANGYVAGYAQGYDAARAARVESAIRYHAEFGAGLDAGWRNGLYGP